MKATRKQKLRKKEEKQRRSDDRKYAVVERMLCFYGLTDLFNPLDWMTKAEVVVGISPGLEVHVAPDSQDDPELEEIRAACEKTVATPVPFSSEGQVVELSLDDICRSVHTIRALVNFVYECAAKGRFRAFSGFARASS